MKEIAEQLKNMDSYVFGGILATSIDKEAKVLYCNDTFCEMSGESGWPEVLENVVHPYDREGLWQKMFELDSENFQCIFRLKQRDGQYLAVLDNAKKVRPKKGKRIWVHILSDVNSAYLKHEKLRIKKTQVEALFDSMNCGHVLCENDADYSIHYVSRAFCTMLGYEKEDAEMLETKSWMELIMPDDREAVRNQMERCFLEGPDYVVECRVRKSNGLNVWVMSCGRKFLDIDGNIRINSILIDINSNKQLMEQLRRSEEKLDLAIRRTGLNLWEYDVKRREITLDERMRQDMPEFPVVISDMPDSLIASGYYEKESIIEVKKLYEKVHAGAKYAMAEVAYCPAAENEVKWERIHYATVCDEKGEPIRATAIAEDITEQKRNEEMYRKERQYRMAMAADSLATCAADVTEDQMLDWSENFYIASELDKNNLALSKVVEAMQNDLIHPEFGSKFAKTLSRRNLLELYQNGIFETTLQYLGIGRKHKYQWRQLMARLVRNPKDSHLNVYVSIRDINEERKSRASTKRLVAEALYTAERSNEEKSKYLNQVSHDMRNPLNSIMGTASLAMELAEDKQNLKEYLEQIEKTGEYMAGLLDKFANVDEIESGKIEREKLDFCMRDVIATSVFIAQNQFADKELTIQSAYKIQHPYLKGDPLRLKQILIELLTCLCQCADKRNEIPICVVELASEGKRVEVEIRFDLDQLELSEENEDLYLSEAMVKGMCRMMGGNYIRKNGECVIALPFEEGAMVDTGSDKRTAISFQRQRILVAEDNEINAEMLRTILQSKNLVVDVAENGQIALDAIKKQGEGYYSLILMDIRMPVMDGIQAAVQIGKWEDDNHMSRTPIVGLSGDVFEEDILNAREAGMKEYLTKPIKNRTLFSTIYNLLENRDKA